MKIAGEYSFANGADVVKNNFGAQFDELRSALSTIDAEAHRTKKGVETARVGKMLFSPTGLNAALKAELMPLGWQPHRENCEYSTEYYVDGFQPNARPVANAYREMDFVKNRLGVEVQFGKYAFMVYNVAAKMTIFRELGVIDAGVEIVPLKEFADHMSTGVSYFEQFCWDLDKRGTSNIDIPVLILGITYD